MRKPLFLMVFAVVTLWSCSNQTASTENVALESSLDSVSYGLGTLMAQQLKTFGELNSIALAKGIDDATSESGETLIQPQDANALIEAYLKKEAETKFAGKKAEGKAFLAANKDKEGVIVTQSGLQYKVITEGTGASPTPTDKVKCHYHGTLIDGTVFDSSVDRGEPIDFPVSGVIRGWTEALQLMKEGSKWELYIPYDLAYGERGTQGIDPFSTLIFEVELIKVNPE